MKLALHTVICCCVFTTVLPLVKGATEELNTSLKKRFRVWLQSRMKRDLHDSLEQLHELCSEIQDGLQQDGTANNVSPPPSFGLNVRSRRAASSKSAGCVLVTCSYQNLLYRLHQITKYKEAKAPDTKIRSTGYGRRRRSLLDVALLAGRQRRSTKAGQLVRRLKSTRTVA
uniref:pro-adrenomedullin n=1 Tax=Semicossyphus pulcher TaxID=241346 RepID=UPI0037E857A0